MNEYQAISDAFTTISKNFLDLKELSPVSSQNIRGKRNIIIVNIHSTNEINCRNIYIDWIANHIENRIINYDLENDMIIGIASYGNYNMFSFKLNTILHILQPNDETNLLICNTNHINTKIVIDLDKMDNNKLIRYVSNCNNIIGDGIFSIPYGLYKYTGGIPISSLNYLNHFLYKIKLDLLQQFQINGNKIEQNTNETLYSDDEYYSTLQTNLKDFVSLSSATLYNNDFYYFIPRDIDLLCSTGELLTMDYNNFEYYYNKMNNTNIRCYKTDLNIQYYDLTNTVDSYPIIMHDGFENKTPVYKQLPNGQQQLTGYSSIKTTYPAFKLYKNNKYESITSISKYICEILIDTFGYGITHNLISHDKSIQPSYNFNQQILNNQYRYVPSFLSYFEKTFSKVNSTPLNLCSFSKADEQQAIIKNQLNNLFTKDLFTENNVKGMFLLLLINWYKDRNNSMKIIPELKSQMDIIFGPFKLYL